MMASWEACNTWTNNTIRDIVVIDTSTVAAISSASESKRFRITEDGGTTWNDVGSPTNANRAITFGDLSVGVAVGDSGAIELFSEGSWSEQTSGITQTLRTVAASSSTSIFVVGNNGTILFNNGSAWSSQESTTSQDLYSVAHPGGTIAWAVGDSGTIVFTEDGTWTTQESGTTEKLYGVDSPSEMGVVFAVGANGTILRLIID